MNMEYWVGVVNVLNPVSLILAMVCWFTAIFCAAEIYAPTQPSNATNLKIPAIVAFIAAVIFLLLFVFVPSADAIRAMYR